MRSAAAHPAGEVEQAADDEGPADAANGSDEEPDDLDEAADALDAAHALNELASLDAEDEGDCRGDARGDGEEAGPSGRPDVGRLSADFIDRIVEEADLSYHPVMIKQYKANLRRLLRFCSHDSNGRPRKVPLTIHLASEEGLAVAVQFMADCVGKNFPGQKSKRVLSYSTLIAMHAMLQWKYSKQAAQGVSPTMEFNAPCRTTKYPREVPPLPWFRQALPQMAMAVALLFGPKLPPTEAGAVANLTAVLKEPHAGPERGPLAATLALLGALAVDAEGREAALAAGVVPAAVRILRAPELHVEVAAAAARLLGRLAHLAEAGAACRSAGGIPALLRLLQRPGSASPAAGGRGAGPPAAVAIAVAEAVTVLCAGHEVNQDAVRDAYGIAVLVDLLGCANAVQAGLAAAACDALTAVAAGSAANKAAVRDAWALPLLVGLLAPPAPEAVAERAAGCLQALTAGCEDNTAALLGTNSALPALVRCLGPSAGMALRERCAAVVASLSLSEAALQPLREANAVPPLIQLLETGPRARATELAALALANLAAANTNRRAIRLSGGVPPLARLLTLRPSAQVLAGAEEALQRLHVSDAERNAVLDTFQYVDARLGPASLEAWARAGAVGEGTAPAAPAVGAGISVQGGGGGGGVAAPKPFTRYTASETCALLADLGFRDTEAFAEVTGGDLLGLSAAELGEDLGVTAFQAKKVAMVQQAHALFNAIMRSPGRAEVTLAEMQEWMQTMGRSSAEAEHVAAGLADALGRSAPAIISFAEFARCYHCELLLACLERGRLSP
ncbi:hypothetical protein WJX81_008494 [Elliptochloris bilobata]|uniref:SAM domain-containing protein n=1 Tax=Elliptochloris bilobata TaxID=381761 RepID=A0AAW1SJR0_9CHLO